MIETVSTAPVATAPDMGVRDTDAPDFAALRHAMVASQLRPSGVDDARVVTAMMQVPRERFVPPAARDFAYRDTLLAVGPGRWISPALATGLLLTEARLRRTDRVLLIGAAGGYAAALLAGLVAEVVAVESDAALAGHARDALSGLINVRLVEGALKAGAADGGPYDVLLIDGAVADVPDALAEQVVPGGRIVTGLVERGVTRLAAGTRSARGAGLAAFLDVEVAVLPGFARARGFSF